ncbi:MAG: hypothetical protein J5J00_04965 [Deltaproteobacteria bacterium]|nr:hypothetical protein [Deltaproteobacteria bacterium]
MRPSTVSRSAELLPEDVYSLRVINDEALQVNLNPSPRSFGAIAGYKAAIRALPSDKDLVINLRYSGMVSDEVLGALISLKRTLSSNGRQVLLADPDPLYKESLAAKNLQLFMPITNLEEAITSVGGEKRSSLTLEYLHEILTEAERLWPTEGEPRRGSHPAPVLDGRVIAFEREGRMTIQTNSPSLPDDSPLTQVFNDELANYSRAFPIIVDLQGVRFLSETAVGGIVKAMIQCKNAGNDFQICNCFGQPETSLRAKRLLPSPY